MIGLIEWVFVRIQTNSVTLWVYRVDMWDIRWLANFHRIVQLLHWQDKTKKKLNQYPVNTTVRLLFVFIESSPCICAELKESSNEQTCMCSAVSWNISYSILCHWSIYFVTDGEDDDRDDSFRHFYFCLFTWFCIICERCSQSFVG
jgi:hypothetical protein